MLIWKGHTRIIKSNSSFCDLKPSTCCFVLCAPLKTMLYPRSVRKTHQARLQQAGSSADWDLWAKLLLGCPSSFPAHWQSCVERRTRLRIFGDYFLAPSAIVSLWNTSLGLLKEYMLCSPQKATSFSCVFLKIQIWLTQFLAQLFPSTFCFVKLCFVNVPSWI